MASTMSITIHCPKCNAGLKLPDRTLLGRTGRCAKCRHRFVLEEPDEVQLELAEVPPPPPEPMVGTSPRWVPDAGSPQNAPPPEYPVLPSVNAPGAQTNTAAMAAPSLEIAPAGPAFPQLNAESPESEEGTVTDRIRGRRKKKSRTGPIVVGVGTALFAFCMLGLWWQRNDDNNPVAQDDQPEVNEEWQEEKLSMATEDEDARALSPTDGDPIPLRYMPFTPHLVIHIRPSELWAPKRRHGETLANLGELAGWLKQDVIERITRFQPEEIEELTIAMNFGARMSEPDLAAVVRLRNEQTMSDLKGKRLKGELRTDLTTAEVMEHNDYAYTILDRKTFVVATANLSIELSEVKKVSREPSVELEVLLRESDRKRLVSMLFDVQNIDAHKEFVLPDDMQMLAEKFVLWFGEDVQSVCWSMHLTNEAMFMETLVHNTNASSTLKVNRSMKGGLSKLPGELAEMAKMMTPTAIGRRQLIGRLPAMMHGLALGTKISVASDFVRMTTFLPDKAAPNLAAAALFAWNQSLTTDFDGPAPVAVVQQKIPDKVVDRLKQIKVYVDYARTPLNQVLNMISEDIKTPIELDGSALMLVGITQVEKQTMSLGDVPAITVLDRIVSTEKFRGNIVVIVDEQAKKITVTSRPSAEEKGLEIFDTKQ